MRDPLRIERDILVRELGGDADPTLYEEAVASFDTLMSAKPSPWVFMGVLDLSWKLTDELPEASLLALTPGPPLSQTSLVTGQCIGLRPR